MADDNPRDDGERPNFAAVRLLLIDTPPQFDGETRISQLAHGEPHLLADAVASTSVDSLLHPGGPMVWAGETVDSVVDAFLAAAEPKGEQIREIADATGASVLVDIWWAPGAEQGGFSVPPQQLARVARLCDHISFFFGRSG